MQSQFSPAAVAIIRASVELGLSDGITWPPWLGEAFRVIVNLSVLAWNEQQAMPTRAPVRDALTRLRDSIEAVEAQYRDSPYILRSLFAGLLPDPQARMGLFNLIATLSGRGQADVLDALGWPAPKLVIAVGIVALCIQLRGSMPNAKNRAAVDLCAALLRVGMGPAAPADDADITQWMGVLGKARRVYRDAAPGDMAATAARNMVDRVLADILVKNSLPAG